MQHIIYIIIIKYKISDFRRVNPLSVARRAPPSRGGAANGLSGGKLHRLLAREEMPLQRILVPPVHVIARRSMISLPDRSGGYPGDALYS